MIRALSTLLILGWAQAREIVPLNNDWNFHQGKADGAHQVDFDDSSWQQVDVPHDWSIAGPFDEDAAAGASGAWLPTGVSWYRKTFGAPEERGAIWVEFDGVMEDSKVWLNGERVGGRPYGYTSFRCDLTDSIMDGRNLLVVKSDTSQQPASRWYTGSGIYRHVRLIAADKAHILPNSVFVSTAEIEDEQAIVEGSLNLSESATGAEVRAVASRPDGSEVARTDVWGGKFRLEIPDPQLWSLDSPNLYSVTVEVLRDGKVIDSVTENFGVRRAEFRSETGFWLNGENFKLKGVCLHHDGGAVGAAVPRDVWERRLRELKELGVNAIRTAHNPADPAFLDLCDELGLLVMSEAFDCWVSGKNRHDYNEHFKQWWERDLRAMVRHARNHPSVILYSVGNEIRDTHREELSKDILAALVKVCHEEDPTRPVTQGLFRPNESNDYDNGLADTLDVIGTNYRDKELLAAWEDKEGRKIVGTEQGHARGTWFDCRDNPQHAGQFLWCGIDYLGEAWDWPITTFNAGLLDRAGNRYPRGWERMSWWSDTPMVKIFRRIAPTEATPEDPGYEDIQWERRQVRFPDWTPRENGAQEVEIYSNADEVELFLNGQSLGAKQVRKDWSLNWKVPYEPGSLRAVARTNGEEVAVDEIRTAKEPVRLSVKSDRDALLPDFDHVAHLAVEVVDENGVRIPRATDQISFQVEGPGEIIAVDNGSIISHEPFQAEKRKAYQGRCLAIVRATADAGEIRVTVSADGLESDSVVIEAGKP
jgi:beta-galactosidase